MEENTMAKFNQPSMAEEEMNRQMADILQENRTAKANDIYCNGGILDALSFTGDMMRYYVPSANDRKKLLEDSFVLSELRFVSAFRLLDAADVDIDKMIAFLIKWKEIIAANPIRTDGPFMRPNPNPWSPAAIYNTGYAPARFNPAPMEIPKEWRGETPSDISRREMSPKNWDDYFASLSNDDVQKGSNETEDETEKKQKEFTEMLYGSTSGVPGPVEPGGLKDRVSLKAILDYPSTGIAINENPVPLTTDEKDSVDKDNEED